jgi:alpha-1,6-mannosyltransferase
MRMHFVDTTMFFCPRSGGVKRYLLAKRAWIRRASRAFSHTILVPAPQADADQVSTCGGIGIPLVAGYRFPLDTPHWRRTLERLQPDLIEVGDPYVPLLAALGARREKDIPVVAFFHSDLPRMLAQRFGSWIAPAAVRYLKSLYAEVDLVLAPSRAMYETLRSWNLDHVARQPLGVDTEVFHPARRDPAFRARLGLAQSTRLVIYAGRFAREKNLPVLEEAIAQLGDPYHLVMIGGERTERRGARVTVLPYQSNAVQLAAWMASGDVFAHAGDQETFGLVALEGMACGLPVVAVGKGGLAETVTSSVGLAVPEATATAFAEGISALFDGDLEELRQSARQYAVESHSWSTAFKALLRNYASVVAHGKHRQELLEPLLGT